MLIADQKLAEVRETTGNTEITDLLKKWVTE